MPQTPGQRLDACLAPFLAQQQQLASELALQQEQLLAITRAMDATRQALEGLEVDMSHAVRRALQEDPSLRRVLGLQVEDVLGDDGSMGWLEGAGPQTSEPATEATHTAPSDAGVVTFDKDDASDGPTLPDNNQTSEPGESLGRLQTRVFPPPKHEEDELDLDCDFETPEDILAEDDAETVATDNPLEAAETEPAESNFDETSTTDASSDGGDGDCDDTFAAPEPKAASIENTDASGETESSQASDATPDALSGDELEDDFADTLADLGDFEAPEPAEPIAAPGTPETPNPAVDETSETNEAVLAETTDAPSVTAVAPANTEADAAAEPTEAVVPEQIATSESIDDSVEASSDPCDAAAAATQTDAAPDASQAKPESTATDGADAAIVESQPEVVDVDNVVLDAPDSQNALATDQDVAKAEPSSEPAPAHAPAEAVDAPMEATDEDNTEAVAPAATAAAVETEAAIDQPAIDVGEATAEEADATTDETAAEIATEPPVDDIDFSDPEALSQALDAAMAEGGFIDADMEEAAEPAASDDTPETAEPPSQMPGTGPKGLAAMDPAEFDLDLPEDTPQQDAA